MPKQSSFASTDDYYMTLFHELVHSTGHESRLNRKEVAENANYGSELYSQEELTAEIGACATLVVSRGSQHGTPKGWS